MSSSDSPTMRICPQCEARTTDKRCGVCGATTVNEALLERHDGPDANIGRILADQYQLLERLGRGGMGTVYRANQLSMNRPVAVKLIVPEIAGKMEIIKRFQRESQLMSRLTHPNSIQVFDFGVTEDDGLLYIVMELLEGRELAEEMEETGAMPVGRAANIAVQVLKALREAHVVGITHRDLKPQNVFLRAVPGEEHDVVKVMDYGVAKLADANTQVTKTGAVVGTPAYMSPEQAMGKDIDGRSDLYSLGVMLFEMITGRAPFVGETPMSVMMQHTMDAPPAITTLRGDLPNAETIQRVLDALLAKDATQRPADANAAIALIEPLLGGPLTHVSGVSAVERPPTVDVNARTVAGDDMVTGTAGSPVSESAYTELGAAPASRKRRMLWPAVAGIVIGLGAVGTMAALDVFSSERDAGAATPATESPTAKVAVKPGGGEAPKKTVETTDETAEEEPKAAGVQGEGGDEAAVAAEGDAEENPVAEADGAAEDDGPAAEADVAGSAATEDAGPSEAEPEMREVTIASSPSGAKVLLNGGELGETPYVLKVNGPTEVEVKRRGYHDASVTVDLDSDPNVVVKLDRKRRKGRSASSDDEEEDEALETEEKTAKAEEKTAKAEEKPPGAEEKPPKAEEKTAKTEEKGTKAADKPPTPPRPTTVVPDSASEAKTAYRQGKLTRDQYNAHIRRLKLKYKARITALKQAYRDGRITRAEYDERARAAKLDYKGQ